MGTKTERLEIRLPEETLRELRKLAAAQGVPVSRLARQAIDCLVHAGTEDRINAARSLFQLESPVSDWPTMKREIEDARGQ